jgi:hypothetical protein
MKFIFLRSQIFIVVFALIGLSVYVSLLLYANYLASGPDAYIKGWQKTSSISDEKKWQENIVRLQKALAIDADNPEYLAKEAMLYRYKARLYSPMSEQSNDANREALLRYQYLLTLRPSWAPYWGGIISIKYDLWEFDEDMLDAMKKAARLAPWFRVNQHILLRAGYHGWPFIDVETREIVNNTLARAMKLQPKPTIQFAFEQGFYERVLPYVEGDEELLGVYEKALAVRKRGG